MSLVTKKRGSTDYLYDQSSDSGRMKATYLGKVGDPKTEARVVEFSETEKKRKGEKKSKKKDEKVFGDIPVLKETESVMEKTFTPPRMNKKQIQKRQVWGNPPAPSQSGLVGRVSDTVNRKVDERRTQKRSPDQ
jgi:hypothetical protein